MIPFNIPYLSGDEENYIFEAVRNGKISGNGQFTEKCHLHFNQKSFNKVLLTTSCTDALEMAAILCCIKPGDEVIVPSYTFVSSALAFVREGAKIIFADSLPDHPNIDPAQIEELITPKTKAIVVVHYAGIACDMDKILHLAKKYNLKVIEDAAHSINSSYKDQPLGSIGDFGAFSFHETKNIQCGEGGLIAINNNEFQNRAEIIWEKGTNRTAFFRGEVLKYEWIDTGSSFLPSEITAAYLLAQLESVDSIQTKRIHIWNRYFNLLKELENAGYICLPKIPDYATNNGHMFYITCSNITQRTQLLDHLHNNGIHAVFHYQALHTSSYYAEKHDDRELPNADKFEKTLLRLPLFITLSDEQIDKICKEIKVFFS